MLLRRGRARRRAILASSWRYASKDGCYELGLDPAAGEYSVAAPDSPLKDARVNVPETRYAKTADGVHIAYHVIGDGPIDIIWLHTMIGEIGRASCRERV